MKKIISVLIFFFAATFMVSCNKGERRVEEQAEVEDTHFSYSYSENKISLKKGKKLDNLVKCGEDGPYYCNSEDNLQWGIGTQPVLVCKDPVYDITYYVNYGRDYFIYALRDGVSELVAELPGRELYCRNGELYFIMDSYGSYVFEGIEEGDIVRYSPVDGSVECVLKSGADTMIVYPDGICYKIVKEMTVYGSEENEDTHYIGNETLFYYSFEKGTTIPFPEGVNEITRWKNLHSLVLKELLPETDPSVQQMRALGYTEPIYAGVRTELVDVDGNVKGTLMGRNTFPVSYKLCGDVMYYVEHRESTDTEQGGFYFVAEHVETGEKEDVAVLACGVKSDGLLWYGDTLYFGMALRVSLKDGAQSCPVFEDSSLMGSIDVFYTDGETVFCLYGDKLWRFEEKRDTPLFTKETEEGKTLEIGEYRYVLHPLGE